MTRICHSLLALGDSIHICSSAHNLYFLEISLGVFTHSSTLFLQLQDNDSAILTDTGGRLEDISICVLCVSNCVCVRFNFFYVLQCKSADPAADPKWQVVG